NPHSPVGKKSHSVKPAARLADAGYVVNVHDPLAQEAAVAALGDKAVEASSMEQAVRDCDMLIVATGWPQYKAIDPAWCKRSNGTRLTVLDLWRTLPAEEFADVADVLYLGSCRYQKRSGGASRRRDRRPLEPGRLVDLVAQRVPGGEGAAVVRH